MKIASIETGIVALPNDEPLAGFSENPSATNPIVTLRIRTDDGVEGLGVTYFGGALTRTLRRAVDELGALAIGEDPMRVEAVAAKLRTAAGESGPAGIFTMALSAIDVALWDIKGKALGLPLWKLLGGGARPYRHLRQRCAAPRPQTRRGGHRCGKATRERPSSSQNATRPTGRRVASARSRASPADPRGGRPRHGSDVRHQPALAGRAGDRYRQTRRRRRGRALLARRRDGARRLRRGSLGSPRHWRPRSPAASISTASCRSAICSKPVRSIS